VRTGGVGGRHAGEDREAPPHVDHQSAAAQSLAARQQDIGDDAGAEQHEQARAHELGEEHGAQSVHGDDGLSRWRGVSPSSEAVGAALRYAD